MEVVRRTVGRTRTLTLGAWTFLLSFILDQYLTSEFLLVVELFVVALSMAEFPDVNS